MNVTLDEQNTAYCLAAFLERDRLRAELAAASARIAELAELEAERPEPTASPSPSS